MSTNRSLIRNAERIQVEDGQFGHTSSGQRFQYWKGAISLIESEEKVFYMKRMHPDFFSTHNTLAFRYTAFNYSKSLNSSVKEWTASSDGWFN